MIKKLVGLMVLTASVFIFIQCDAPVKFTGKSAQELSGKLYKPEGNGPFPAVVLMHGCGGTGEVYENWAELLKKSGFVAFVLDSFKTRGVASVCGKKGLSPTFKERVPDALDARDYLASLSFVDSKKISAIGWSHGGVSTLMLSIKSKETPADFKPFYKVISFYPYCPDFKDDYALNSPFLILIGGKDDWVSSKACTALEVKMKEKKEDLTVIVYPDATHAFDFVGVNTIKNGHILKYDEKATIDARKKVLDFLQKN